MDTYQWCPLRAKQFSVKYQHNTDNITFRCEDELNENCVTLLTCLQCIMFHIKQLMCKEDHLILNSEYHTIKFSNSNINFRL